MPYVCQLLLLRIAQTLTIVVSSATSVAIVREDSECGVVCCEDCDGKLPQEPREHLVGGLGRATANVKLTEGGSPPHTHTSLE